MNNVSLNPLNQVYVFNLEKIRSKDYDKWEHSLNPLNQVYVFNAFFDY